MSWVATGAFLEARVYKSPSLLLFKPVFLNVGYMGSQNPTLLSKEPQSNGTN
jgi:hypothetical protein